MYDPQPSGSKNTRHLVPFATKIATSAFSGPSCHQISLCRFSTKGGTWWSAWFKGEMPSSNQWMRWRSSCSATATRQQREDRHLRIEMTSKLLVVAPRHPANTERVVISARLEAELARNLSARVFSSVLARNYAAARYAFKSKEERWMLCKWPVSRNPALLSWQRWMLWESHASRNPALFSWQRWMFCESDVFRNPALLSWQQGCARMPKNMCTNARPLSGAVSIDKACILRQLIASLCY